MKQVTAIIELTHTIAGSIVTRAVYDRELLVGQLRLVSITERNAWTRDEQLAVSVGWNVVQISIDDPVLDVGHRATNRGHVVIG